MTSMKLKQKNITYIKSKKNLIKSQSEKEIFSGIKKYIEVFILFCFRLIVQITVHIVKIFYSWKPERLKLARNYSNRRTAGSDRKPLLFLFLYFGYFTVALISW